MRAGSDRDGQTGLVGFFEEILGMGHGIRIRVTGGSMSPFIRGGDVVIIREAPMGSLGAGDIVLFKGAGGRPMLHRLIEMREQEDDAVLLTRGDAIMQYDEPVRPCDVLGRVVKVQKYGRPEGDAEYDLESLRWRIISVALARLAMIETALYGGILGRFGWGRALRPALQSPLVLAWARCRPFRAVFSCSTSEA